MANLITEKGVYRIKFLLRLQGGYCHLLFQYHRKASRDPHNLAESSELQPPQVRFRPKPCNPKFQDADSIVGDDVVRGLKAVEV